MKLTELQNILGEEINKVRSNDADEDSIKKANAAKAGSEKATEELANAMQLIALVAPHIERWERNYGTRLSGDMKEIVRLYKQIKEEGSK
jgi:hypothetical protein